MESPAISPSNGPWRVDVTRHPEVAASAWRRLESSGLCTPFQTRAWALAVYRHIAPAARAEPLIVLVSRASTGEPVMLLPLCVRRHGLATGIVFADLGVSDYNAPLLARDLDLTAEEARQLWRQIRLALPAADYVRFDKCPELVGGRPNPALLFVPHRPHSFKSWAVPLPDSWPRFETSTVPSRMAKELRRKTRILEEGGKLALRREACPAGTRAVWAALMAQRQARFAELGRENPLTCAAIEQFYRALVVEGVEGDFARLEGLWVGDELVATLFGVCHDQRYHLLMSTMAMGKWSRAAPGIIAITRSMSRLIGEGYTAFDFTIGDERYKKDFNAVPSSMYTGLQALSARAALPVATARWMADLKDGIRPVVHDVRARLNRKGKVS